MLTIRNCRRRPRGGCPAAWDRLAPGPVEAARDCPVCDRRVYQCVTDGETVAHVRAGHLVARDEPTDMELGTVYLDGRPQAWGPPTPDQAEARQRREREQAIDDALGSVRESSRDCPGCGYPVPNYRVGCRVCGVVIGRLYDPDGNVLWASPPE